MSIKNDRWIREMATKHGMIDPFEPGQVRRTSAGERQISFGTSSYGYDVRCADHFKIFTNINSAVVDPKNFDVNTMVYLIIWVVVGGTRTFWGAIIGLTVMTIIFEWSRPLLEWRPALFGGILIFFLVFMPGGLESLIPKIKSLLRKFVPERKLAEDGS